MTLARDNDAFARVIRKVSISARIDGNKINDIAQYMSCKSI